MIEKQLGTLKGHRVLINYDEEGKPISFKPIQYLSPKEYEQLQYDCEINQKALLELQKEEEREIAKEQDKIALEKAKEAKIEAYKKKYSIEHFLLWHSTIQAQLDHGVIQSEEDDGTFILLVDRVLEKDLTIEEAVNLNKSFGKVFEAMFGGEE